MEGILEDGEDFTEFRGRVVELIKDVVFIVGSSNVFKHMLVQMVLLNEHLLINTQPIHYFKS